MKKLLFYFILLLFLGSCVTPYGTSKYHIVTLRKFNHKKNIRPNWGPKHVRPYKRGDVMDRSVKKTTRKNIKQNIKRERSTHTD